MNYMPPVSPLLREIHAYFGALAEVPQDAISTDAAARTMRLDDAFIQIIGVAKDAHARGNKLMFIGNGGSAGIASHMAIDYSKTGNLRALAFNDGAALTCLGNDLGYDQVFARQIELHARPGDYLIAISSSGASPNILRGVEAARECGCTVLTLSGFSADNPLRRLGDINLYVPHGSYGLVEIAHLALCHAILDLASRCGDGDDTL